MAEEVREGAVGRELPALAVVCVADWVVSVFAQMSVLWAYRYGGRAKRRTHLDQVVVSTVIPRRPTTVLIDDRARLDAEVAACQPRPDLLAAEPV